MSDLVAAKAAAKKELADIVGVEGFGIGTDALRVYVRSPGVQEHLPSEFHGVPVQCVVTGSIMPLGT
jgi:hypothetical protein